MHACLAAEIELASGPCRLNNAPMRDGAGARQVARTGGVNQPEQARSSVAAGVLLVARETRRARREAVRWCRAGSIPVLSAGAEPPNTWCRPHAPRLRRSL